MIFNDAYSYKVTRAAGEQAWQAVVVAGERRTTGTGETPEEALYAAQSVITGAQPEASRPFPPSGAVVGTGDGQPNHGGTTGNASPQPDPQTTVEPLPDTAPKEPVNPVHGVGDATGE